MFRGIGVSVTETAMRIVRLLQPLAVLLLGYASFAAAAEAVQPSALQSLFTDPAPDAAASANNSFAVAAAQRRLRTPDKTDETLRREIGQMIMIGFPGTEPNDEWPARVNRMVRDGSIGGVILYSENVVDPGQLKRLTSALEPKDGNRQPFVCVDQEGGAIQRLTPAKGFVGLPAAEHVAAMSPATASRLYRDAAEELARLGINCNFGPVVDLDIDPDSQAIGRLGRSYGRDPKTVIEYARLFIDAHHRAGVLTVAKHFPGHGSAHDDTHDQVVDITHTWQEAELEPFQALIDDNRVDMIMVGHLILKEQRFDDGDLPASLSRKAIQQELRAQFGFRGLVVSDDLDMGAIRNRYGVEQAAVMAIEAGCDLVIVANTKMPDPDIADRIIAKVMRAVAKGQIKRESIIQAYNRILQAKKRMAEQRTYVMD
jgi:beta-N-acetylhexosaminidase